MWITDIFSKNKKILALAPMADMTDSPFCCICRKVSGKDFVIFREMVSAEAVARGSEKTLKMCEFKKVERPIIQQIFGANADVIVKAAEIIMKKFKPDGIDVNMGCPVPKIAGKADSGSALMKDVERAVNIVKALKNANLGVPVSVKTRLGWSKDDEILDFASRLEQAGIDLISIHGRTKTQGYSGRANWEMIGRVKKKLSIPVVANGDINNYDDAKQCLKITKADGIMMGRGVLGNPWLFKQIEKNSSELVDMQERVEVVLDHAKLHVKHYGERGIVTFRKHLAWYFKGNKMEHGMTGIKQLRAKLVRVEFVEELNETLRCLQN